MLTNVCTYKNGKWERISVEEASKLYPYTVPARSRVFICNLCGQYVAFANPKEKVRYFTHNRGDIDKNCEERSQYYNSEPFSENEKNLPIKLILNSVRPEFFIGIPAIQEKLLLEHRSDKVFILYGNSRREYNLERLSSSAITYLSVGTTLMSQYKLQFSDKDVEERVKWPNITIGYDGNGRLFEKASGRMLAFDSDVTVGTDYYYLSNARLSERNNPIVRYVMRLADGKHLHQIRATESDKESADFFLRLRARLSGAPVKSNILWPPSVIKDDIVVHNQNTAYITSIGNIKVSSNGVVIKPIVENNSEMFKVSVGKDHCNVLIGRSEVLKSWYFIRSDLTESKSVPEVIIKDINDIRIDNDCYYKAPSKKKLFIESEYDGEVLVIRPQDKYFYYNLSSGTGLELSDIDIDTTVNIFIGTDLIRTIAFIKKNEDIVSKDIDYEYLISLKGNRVRVSKSIIGNIAAKINDKRITVWLRKQNGLIPIEAFELLKNVSINGEK